jgi:hypothetical protein
VKKVILNLSIATIFGLGFSGCVGSSNKNVPLNYYNLPMENKVLTADRNTTYSKFDISGNYDKLNKNFKSYILKNEAKGIYINNLQEYVRTNTGKFYAMLMVGVVDNKIYFVGGTSTGFISYEKSLQVYDINTKQVERIVGENDIVEFFNSGDSWAIKVLSKNDKTRYISLNDLSEYNGLSKEFKPFKIKTYHTLARGGLDISYKNNTTMSDLWNYLSMYALYGKLPIIIK